MVTEFEYYLIDQFMEERGSRFNNLSKWKGYNLDFKWMVDDLYAMLTDKRTRWDVIDNIRFFHTENFMFRKVCFLGRISITVVHYTNQTVNRSGESEAGSSHAVLRVFQDGVGFMHNYDPDVDKNISTDNILFDRCSVKITVYSTGNALPEYEFKSLLWHELMHLYQIYQEYIKNRNTLPNNVNDSNIVYSNIVNRLKAYSDGKNPEMVQILKALYKLDQDEINANLSVIYPFIQKNFLASYYNIMDYLPQLDIYKNIELAKSTKELMGRIIRNKDKKEKVDNELYEIFSHRYKKEDCSKLFLKFLMRMIPYMQSKMYRNAKSALEDLSRPAYLTELDAKLSRL